MAAFAFASLVFLSLATPDRALLIGRELSPMAAEEYLDSDGLASDDLAVAVVRAAMNNSHASVLLDRKKRDFVAAMLAKITRELEPKEPVVADGGETEGTDAADDGKTEGTDAADDGKTEGTDAADGGAADDGETEESTQPTFDAILSCFFGPGLGTTDLVLDSVNAVRNIKKCSTHGCLARAIIGFVGKILGWGASIYNIEQSCGDPLFAELQDCTSTKSHFIGTPAAKNLPTLYVRVLGTGLVASAAVWGTILQCKSKIGGEKLAPGTDWAYLVTKLVRAVKFSTDAVRAYQVIQDTKQTPTTLDDIAATTPALCAKSMKMLSAIPASVATFLRLDGQLKADDDNEMAGGSSWCAGAVAATAAQIPALVASFCGYKACEGKYPAASVTELSY